MRTAIYYPHTRPPNTDILRTALLLWDEVEFIVPWKGYRPDHVDSHVEEIVELIGRETVPDDEAKRLAHERIEEFATQQLPAAFRYSRPDPGWDSPFMFARKLLPQTWRMLHELDLVGMVDGRASALSDETGLALMSILTDCCAGERKARITDRTDAYARLSRFIIGADGGSAEDEGSQQHVVPITMKVLEAGDLPLRQLVDLRRREARSQGDDLRRLRQRYRDRVERQVQALASANLASDRRELQREFEIEMHDDLADLRGELRLAKREALTSKDVILLGIVTVAAGVAAAKGLHVPVEQVSYAGSLPVVGGVINARSKYAQARRTIIARHPMAYMLELAG